MSLATHADLGDWVLHRSWADSCRQIHHLVEWTVGSDNLGQAELYTDEHITAHRNAHVRYHTVRTPGQAELYTNNPSVSIKNT